MRTLIPFPVLHPIVAPFPVLHPIVAPFAEVFALYVGIRELRHGLHYMTFRPIAVTIILIITPRKWRLAI